MSSIFKQAFDKLFTRLENGDVPEKTINKNEAITNSNINNKIIYNGNNKSIIVIDIDGNKFEGFVEKDDIIKLKTSTTSEIIDILTPVTKDESEDNDKKEVVSNFLSVFDGSRDFDVIGQDLYFKDIKSVPVPTLIVARFVELVEKIKEKGIVAALINKEPCLEEYNSLKMFTFWLLLNPIGSARKDALNFIKKNNLPITSNGMLVTFRKVVSKGSENKNLVKFISESYFKIKKKKKSPKNYSIYSKLGDFMLCKNNKLPKEDNPYWENIGNLHELYQNLHTLKENTYTDNHTKTKTIKIGSIYKEDEDRIDLDNTKDCSSGLHSGSINFCFDSFGDTGVVCLVNPMKIRSVPVADCSKMRSSELFPVAIVDFNNYKEFTETNEILELSEIYYNESLETLKDTLKNKSFGKLTCQGELPQISLKEIQNITELLKNRVVNI